MLAKVIVNILPEYPSPAAEKLCSAFRANIIVHPDGVMDENGSPESEVINVLYLGESLTDAQLEVLLKLETKFKDREIYYPRSLHRYEQYNSHVARYYANLD